jgi:hypothetical protein
MRDSTSKARFWQFLLTAVFAVCGPAAHAETWDVSCNTAALSNTMAVVNTNGEDDTLWLAPSCVYSLAASWVVTADGGNPVRVHGRGATLSGQDARTVLVVNAGATLHLFDTTLRDGLTTTANGGGVRNSGTLTLERSTITESNSSGYGGGLYSTGSATLIRSTVSGNTAGVQGGGIDNANGRLSIFDSTVSGNVGSYGGGVRTRGAAAIFNGTFFGNGAFIGGGILNDPAGRLALSNVTISGNSISGSAGGAGIRNEGELQIDNSIVADHQAVYLDCSNTGTITSFASNLIEDGSCPIVGSFAADPDLSAPVGLPRFLAPRAGSPAIDAGQNPSCTGADQQGAPRPRDGNKDGFVICDLGAIEKQPPRACGLFGFEALVLLWPLARRLLRRAGEGTAAWT